MAYLLGERIRMIEALVFLASLDTPSTGRNNMITSEF